MGINLVQRTSRLTSFQIHVFEIIMLLYVLMIALIVCTTDAELVFREDLPEGVMYTDTAMNNIVQKIPPNGVDCLSPTDFLDMFRGRIARVAAKNGDRWCCKGVGSSIWLNGCEQDQVQCCAGYVLRSAAENCLTFGEYGDMLDLQMKYCHVDLGVL